ncbi:heterokaryon incompatibility protein-domain-containing protein [Phaeosphaeriaceae sp. PMI808]|nr:heterokaryon incompatibility protein-domain-containing protein [Phaeosphaeriaceae sp. PMI808]
MTCPTCNILLSRSATHFHKTSTEDDPHKEAENLPLIALIEAAHAGCSRCIIIVEAVTKWKTVENPDVLVVGLKSGGCKDPAKLVGELDPGLHVSITHKDSWKRQESQGLSYWVRDNFSRYRDFDRGFVLYTDCESTSVRLDIPFLVSVPVVPSAEDYARQAREWLNYCIKNHARRCHRIDQKLPTRVIDVGNSSQDPRLLEVQPGTLGQYAALSYCWGLSRTFTTTIQTFEQRTRGFTLGDLPATIRDAVLLARNMSIPYIWADSLCIVQDSSEDWNKEAARMCDVYTNATVTFAAIDCPESETGLFVASGRRLLQVGKSEEHIFARKHYHGEVGRTHQNLPASATQLKDNVLLSRGWCVQEILLSSRLIWMKGTEMCWSCLCTTACECQPTPRTELISQRGFRMEHSLGGLLNLEHSSSLVSTAHITNWWLKHWFDLVETYAGRSLTQITDRLPAIAGLATWLQKFIQAKYLFGLWETNNFLDQLLWFTTGSFRYTKYYRPPQGQLKRDYAPSWSWASTWGQLGMPWTTLEERSLSGNTTIVLQDRPVISTTPPEPGTPQDTPPGTPPGTAPGSPPGTPKSSSSVDSYLNHRAFNRKLHGKNLNPASAVWTLKTISSHLASSNPFGSGGGEITLHSLVVPVRCYVGPAPTTYHTCSHSFILSGKTFIPDSASPVVLFSPAEYRDVWAPDNRLDHSDSPEWYAEKDFYFVFAQLGVLRKSGDVIDFCGLLLDHLEPEMPDQGGQQHRTFRRLGFAESIFNTPHVEADDGLRRESWKFWQDQGKWETICLV